MSTETPVSERPKSYLEIVGERCVEVIQSNRDKKEADLRMIAEFAWALGIEMRISLAPDPDDAEMPEAR